MDYKLDSFYIIICIIFISNACLNRSLLEYYMSSAKCHSEVREIDSQMQLQYLLMKGLEFVCAFVLCVCVRLCNNMERV